MTVRNFPSAAVSAATFGERPRQAADAAQCAVHTCYFWQAASAGVHSTVPAHSKCAYAE